MINTSIADIIGSPYFMLQDLIQIYYSQIHLLSTLMLLSMKMVLVLLFYIILFLLPLLYLMVIFLRKVLKKRSRMVIDSLPGDQNHETANKKFISVGFFHPYCNAGGGGERVLWCAIRSLQLKYNHVHCIVYTGDVSETPDNIIARAKRRFNIDIKRHVHFVYLHQRKWVTAEMYPYLTLLGQSIGSLILGTEAMLSFTPDVFLDTMGYAFTLPLFKYVGGSKVGCYVHYPTISTDMLKKVTGRYADFNNAEFISRSVLLSNAKLIYYHIFAFVYGLCGSCSNKVMVNSSWTYNHIVHLWNIPSATSIVYPPCDTKQLLEIPMNEMETFKNTPKQIISVAQFRPEKNHSLQLQVFKKFLDNKSEEHCKNFKLLLIGSCRNEGDENRVQLLKAEARNLEISNQVEFHLNITYDEMLTKLKESVVGIHTMKDEHFGIGVVEFMAGGLVALAHNSAGPKMDIVIEWENNRTGYLADTLESYVDALKTIFEKEPKERYKLCLNARECVKNRFSEETFEQRFLDGTKDFFN